MDQRRANVTVNVFAEKSAIYVLDDNNETKVSVSLDVSPIKVFVGDANGDFITYAEVIKLLNESDGVTTVHNAQRLGGFPADHYPRKAENALITGAWRHTGPLALGGNFLADAALHNEGDTILAGNVFLGSDLVSRGGAQAGFSGYGLWYRKEDNHLMIDNLTVRKAMRVYELIVNQIRGTNGSLWVSDTAKIVSAEETATTWRCFIDSNDASSIVPFREGDLIRSQRWTGKGVKYYSSKVVATGADFFELDKGSWDGVSIPEAEDVLVRFGNVSDQDRQGALYLTSSDTDAPYMDVIDGVDSFNLAGKTKVRIGKLNGIFYNTEQLSGYGLYADRALLTGAIRNLNGQWALNEDGSGMLAGGAIQWTNTGALTIGSRNPSEFALVGDVSQFIQATEDDISNLQSIFVALDEDQAQMYLDLQSKGQQIVALDGKYTAVATEQGILSGQYGVLNGQLVDLTGIVNGHSQAILTINGQTIPEMSTDISTANNVIAGIINNIEGEGGINSVLQTLNTDFNALSQEVAYEIHDLNGTLFTQINNLANRKNTRYISATEPVPPAGVDFRIGDEWVKEIEVVEEGETTYEYESYMWFGTEWRPNLTTIDGARITTGVVDAARIIATELFAQEIGAVSLHVAEGFVGGFKINNMLVAESEDGKGISIDPTEREILIKDLQEGLGISQISIRAGDLTPEAELNASGGIGFKSSVTSNELNIRNSNGSEITSSNIRATGGVTVRQYVCSGGVNKAKLKSTVPAVSTERFVIEVGKNYVADLPYNFRIYHNLGTRNRRSHKLHGDLKVTITSRLVGRTANGVTKELVAAAPVITNISRSTRETTMFERPVTRKVSFYNIDCTTAYWEIDVKLEGNLTYQQWTSALDGKYWMTSTGWGIDYRGVIPDGCTISPSMGIMEMTTSGFQFMWGSGRFFRIDGRDPAHFITSQGKWVHNGDFQLNGSDIVTIDNVSSAIASDLSAYATKNYVDTGFYTKSQSDGRYAQIINYYDKTTSDGRFAKKAGDGAQDFNVKDLIIHGQVNQWLAQQLVVDDARIQVNRRQGGATVDSGLVIHDRDTGLEVSRLVYDVNGIWRAGGQRIYTDAYKPLADNATNLGGYSAASYPRKAEDAEITGKWTFNNDVYNRHIRLQRGSNFAAISVLSTGALALAGNDSMAEDVGAFLSPAGNLGLGKFSASERLHVAGNGLFTGNLSAVNAALSGTLSVAHAATLQNTLSVAQAATFAGNAGTSNFASQALGWRVTPAGVADFRHIYTDELQAKAFTADISQALVGSDVLTKSVAKLAQNFQIRANGTHWLLYVEELEGYPGMSVFSIWDKLRLRVFDRSGGGLIIADVWLTVTNHNINDTVNNVQKYTVRFDDDGGVVGSFVYAGSMVLDYGTPGSGVIERTVLDQQGSPYSRVSTWTGSPDNPANYTLHYQSGNLNGLANAEGWGVYSQNSFLTGKLLVGDLTKQGQYMEYENGQLTIKGSITVTGGNAATKADVDAVQVGGRNLARQTFATPTPVTFPQNGFEFPIAEAALIDLFKGGAFTASVIIDEITSLSSNLHIMISVRNANGSAHRQTFSTSYFTAQDSGKLTAHFSLPPIADTDGKYATIHLRTISVGSTSLVYRCMQLETGNRATDWTPAPEDVDAGIAAAETSAKGYADGAAAAAETSAKNFATSEATAALTAAESHTDDLTTRVETTLGLADLEGINETLITGGKVRTSLLEATEIAALVVTAETVEGLTLNFDKGTIGEWEIVAGAISSSAGNIRLQEDAGVFVSPDSLTSNPYASNNRVSMYYASPSDWGLSGRKGGEFVFRLGSTNQIAGINFDDQKLWATNNNWEINSDGSVKFTSGKIANFDISNNSLSSARIGLDGNNIVLRSNVDGMGRIQWKSQVSPFDYPNAEIVKDSEGFKFRSKYQTIDPWGSTLELLTSEITLRNNPVFIESRKSNAATADVYTERYAQRDFLNSNDICAIDKNLDLSISSTINYPQGRKVTIINTRTAEIAIAGLGRSNYVLGAKCCVDIIYYSGVWYAYST